MNNWNFSKVHTNVLKAVAAIGVLVHHLFMYAKPEWGLPCDIEKLRSFALFLKISVAVFVFLSAYGLTKVWKSPFFEQKQSFAEKYNSWVILRYIKLMVGFWFVYVLLILMTLVTDRNIFSVYGPEQLSFMAMAFDFFGLGNLFGTTLLCETWWYMSLAIVVMLCVPLLIEAEKKCGPILILLAILLPNYILPPKEMYAYISPAVLGVSCANHRILEKLHLMSFTKWKVLDILIKVSCAIFVLWIFYQVRTHYGRTFLVDGLSAVVLAILVVELVEIPALVCLKRTLDYIGRHSMNIFLVHTFIFSYYFTDVIYSFRYPVLITIALLGCSLLFSIFVETLKKVLKYDRLIYVACRWMELKILGTICNN